MSNRQQAAVPAAPRKTLLEWIEHDDGDTPAYGMPICSTALQALHAGIAIAPAGQGGNAFEPLSPPPGLALAPLG